MKDLILPKGTRPESTTLFFRTMSATLNTMMGRLPVSVARLVQMGKQAPRSAQITVGGVTAALLLWPVRYEKPVSSVDDAAISKAIKKGDFSALQKEWDAFAVKSVIPGEDDDDDDEDEDEDDEEEDDEEE